MLPRLKEKNRQVSQKLEKAFSTLRAKHKRDPTKVSIPHLDAARLSLNLALTPKAEKSLHWSRARFYHQRDKIGPMLASRLSPHSHIYSLPKIKVAGGASTLDPLSLMKSFHLFYEKLYSVYTKGDPSCIATFLANLPIPTIEDRQQDRMEAPITAEEVLEVIKHSKKESAPDPDNSCLYTSPLFSQVFQLQTER